VGRVTPLSPRGRWAGEEGRINAIFSPTINMIKMKDQCGFMFQPGETLRTHSLPNPSPVQGEGLFALF
jgi:hypothetical protein